MDEGPLDHLNGRDLRGHFVFAVVCILSLVAQLIFSWNWVDALVAATR